MSKASTPLALSALALICCPTSASASASEWHAVAGAQIRLVTSGVPDRDGMLRGALQIDLDPGWKTYWKDPGEAGVPPMLDVEQPKIAATLHFPAPKHFDEGHTEWAGYDRPVSLPVTFGDAGAAMSEMLQVRVFLGVCETICVPVEARFAIEHAADAHNPEHAALVTRAFAALPPAATETTNAAFASWHDDGFSVSIHVEDGAEPLDLFIAGTDAVRLGFPRHVSRGEYAVTVATGDKLLPTQNLSYTLVTTAGAVSGTLVLPAR